MQDQSSYTYDEFIAFVCDELGLEKRDLLVPEPKDDAKFACGLYLQLIADRGISMQRGILLINKPRKMIQPYQDIFAKCIRSDRDCYEHYISCCKKLYIRTDLPDCSEEIDHATNARIKEDIGSLPTDNGYTIAEEMAMARIKESSERYMRNYGKGVQPLQAGHARKRKRR